MTLSTLAILIGIVFCIPQVYALANPEGFTEKARGFPRAIIPGFVLMAVGAAWFLYNLNNEAISDFAAYKRFMMLGFGALALLTCIFVQDFLAVRGLAIILLLAAWVTLNHTRWHDSPWRLVLVVWAYLWIIMGMWLTISPWRMRDHIDWLTSSKSRLRAVSLVRLAFGVLVILLGATAFRS